MTSMAGRYLRDEPGAVRDLALLRRVSNTAPAFTHEVWRLLADLPAQLRGHGDLPSRGERAAIAALGLFARHQQSQRALPMHASGNSFGRGLQQLTANDVVGPGASRRFNSLMAAHAFDSQVWHLRALLTMLRSANPPLPVDFAALARDLYLIQNPSRADGVRLRWSRDFYLHHGSAADAATSSDASATPQPSIA
jgi:CRISPR system Cascade subunit CasB